MTDRDAAPARSSSALDRRELLAYAATFGTAFLAAQGLAVDADAQEPKPAPAAKPAKRYEMKKSINLWAFPYPQQYKLIDCFKLAKSAGFDAVEINFGLDGDLCPTTSEKEIQAIGKMAKDQGIAISGVCSFLYWPYSLTANDPAKRAKGVELARQMIAAAHGLGTDNLLVVPGAVYIPWLKEAEPVANDACEARAREALTTLLPEAEKAGVYLNLENIFANAFLFSPQEMMQFVDSFKHPNLMVHFDTGNIMQYQFPEHWIRMLGKRIKNIHLKEYDKRMTEFTLNAFRPLLDGTTDWPAVLAALDQVGYRGYLTFEYFHPYSHFPEALIYQTADSLDRMLGIKA